MSGIVTDVSRWPLVVITFPDRRVTDDEVRSLIEDQRAFVYRGEPYAVVADASHGHVVSAAQRRMLAAWLVEAEPVSREFTVAMAIVVDNPVMRGGITAVFWLKDPPVPTRAFRTMREAVDYAIGALRDKGLTVPEAPTADL